jgi:hypothetical protein
MILTSLVLKKIMVPCISVVGTLQNSRRVSMKMAGSELKNCPGPEVNRSGIAYLFWMMMMRTSKVYHKAKVVRYSDHLLGYW